MANFVIDTAYRRLNEPPQFLNVLKVQGTRRIFGYALMPFATNFVVNHVSSKSAMSPAVVTLKGQRAPVKLFDFSRLGTASLDRGRSVSAQKSQPTAKTL